MQALCKDDRYRWFRLTCTVIQQKDGKAVRMLGVSENIDHEKEKERQREAKKKSVGKTSGAATAASTDDATLLAALCQYESACLLYTSRCV